MFSFGKFALAAVADAKAVIAKLPSELVIADKIADTVQAYTQPLLSIFFPAEAAGEAAVVKIFDAYVAASTQKNADGTVTFTVPADLVASTEKVVSDTKAWVASTGGSTK